jgi:2-polyprenyl-6-methoxyphenol hydroxylase-like FAD-dependent oxidoreductase
MRIECVGGGPGGLYSALLMKAQDPGHDITVFERGHADSAYGWGVTLSKDVLDILYDNDAESAAEIERAGFRWNRQLVCFQGKQAARDGTDVYNISRQRLVDILANRARRLGVDIRYEHEVFSAGQLPDADLIVAADGASSRIRQANGNFQTETHEGSNKFIWLAAAKMFSCFNYLFARTNAGWVWAYAYGFAPELSTFIVECSAETWDGLGFAAISRGESLALLERLFEAHLDGRRLIGEFPDGTCARWQRYRTVTNQRWHDGNIVLLGDSAHTAHYSVGQGTALAFGDAIALARGIRDEANLGRVLQAYEDQRRADLTRPLSEARCSAQWFENLPRYTALEPQRFATLLHMRRSPLVPVLPPQVSYLLHHATRRSGVLGGVRDRLGPGAKVLYGRRKARRGGNNVRV